MSNVTEFFFGLVLWLGCSGIIVLLSLYQNEAKNKVKTDSNSQPKIPKIPLEQPKTLDKNVSFLQSHEQAISPPEITANQAEKLREELEQKNEQLNLAFQKITALQEELELKSNQLESSHNDYVKLEAKLQQESEQLEEKVFDLRQQCQQLKNDLAQQSEQITIDFLDSTFNELQSLLINYPTAKMMVKVKPDLPAKNLVALLKPLDNLLDNWGIETIGKPWEKVPYNPQIHLADHPDIVKGELVYIRFVGYRHGDRILTTAKVSRTLPGKKES